MVDQAQAGKGQHLPWRARPWFLRMLWLALAVLLVALGAVVIKYVGLSGEGLP